MEIVFENLETVKIDSDWISNFNFHGYDKQLRFENGRLSEFIFFNQGSIILKKGFEKELSSYVSDIEVSKNVLERILSLNEGMFPASSSVPAAPIACPINPFVLFI